MEGEGSECDMSEEEFDESYKVMVMGDWLVMRDRDGNEVMNFVMV